MATYRGVPYEAGVGPANSDVVLFAACPPPEALGFEPATGHWRKQVIRAEIDALWESRPVGVFRGEPCIVLDDLGDRLHVAYLGTDADRARQLGYWQVDRGVFEVLTPKDEVTGLTEERVDRPLRWSEHPGSATARTAYPYGTAPWPALATPAAAAPLPPAPSSGPEHLTAPAPPSGSASPSAPVPPLAPAAPLAPTPVPTLAAPPPAPASPAPEPMAGPVSATPPGADQLSPALPADPYPAEPGAQPLPGSSPAGAAGPAATALPSRPAPGGAAEPPVAGPAVPPAGPPIGEPPTGGPPTAGLPTGGGPPDRPRLDRPRVDGPPLAGPRLAGAPAGGPAPAEPAPAEPGWTMADRSAAPEPAAPGPYPANGAWPPADSMSGPAFSPLPATNGLHATGGAPPVDYPGRTYPGEPGRSTGADLGGRAGRRQRVPTRELFCELADLASIPRSAYALETEAEGAMCLLPTPAGFEVFIAAGGVRHEVRTFAEEETAYFYLFGVLAAEAIRNGVLAPAAAAAGLRQGGG